MSGDSGWQGTAEVEGHTGYSGICYREIKSNNVRGEELGIQSIRSQQRAVRTCGCSTFLSLLDTDRQPWTAASVARDSTLWLKISKLAGFLFGGNCNTPDLVSKDFSAISYLFNASTT